MKEVHFCGFALVGRVPAFSVKKYTAAAKKFTKNEISEFLIKAVETDLSIKQGNIEQWQAIERLVLFGAERKM